MDLFDYKPRLAKEGGNKFPIALAKNYEAPGIGRNLLMAPISTFSRKGKADILMSDMLPKPREGVHELCILNGMQADSEAHAPAVRNCIPDIPSWCGLDLVRGSLTAWARRIRTFLDLLRSVHR